VFGSLRAKPAIAFEPDGRLLRPGLSGDDETVKTGQKAARDE